MLSTTHMLYKISQREAKQKRMRRDMTPAKKKERKQRCLYQNQPEYISQQGKKTLHFIMTSGLILQKDLTV